MKKKIVPVGSLWDTYRAASNAKGLLLMRDGNKVTKVIK